MKKFTEISPLDLNERVFRLIGKEWMLITAGTLERWKAGTR